MDIVLVHGYNVTSTSTYGVLPQRLKSLGHNIKNIYLGKYITLDNDLTLADIIKAFQAALVDTLGENFEKQKFVCITHSTGGLVARGWIHTYYQSRPRALPMSHLIMLAPPTNGSRLASLGKSRLNRLRSLWGAEPGLKVLNALELGSPYQWDLNSAWMDNDYVEIPGFFPVVIAGQWIDHKLWDAIVPATYERGSDGVVRASAANLNLKKIKFRPDGSTEVAVLEGVPFLITPKTSHSDDRYGVMGSVPTKGDHPVLSAIVQVLEVETSKDYQRLANDWAQSTAQLQQQETYYDGSSLDAYSQVVFKVIDSHGDVLDDYAIEFLDAEDRADRFPSGFIAHSAQNSASPEFFTYYLNYNQVTKVVGKEAGFRIQSVAHSPLIQYVDARFKGSLAQVEDLIKPNQTTLIEVQLRRRVNKNTFRFTQNFSKEKIRIIPSDDWID